MINTILDFVKNGATSFGKKIPKKQGDVPIVGPGAPPEDDELTSLFKTFANLQGKISAPPPIAPTLKIDPLESALGSLSSIFAKGTAAKSNAANSALGLAQGRLATESQQQALNYKTQQDSLNKQLSTTGSLINSVMDRDSVESTVKGRIRVAEMKGRTSEIVATLGNNTKLIQTMAELAGKSELTLPGLVMSLSSVYPDMDDESLNNLADGMMKQLESSPTLSMKMEQAKLQMDKNEISAKRVSEALRIVNGEVINAGPQAREASAMFLAQNGDPYWSKQTPKDIQEWSEKRGLADRKMLLEGDKLIQAIEESKADVAYTKERTRLLPEEVQIKVGMLDVALRNMMNASRNTDIAGISAWGKILKDDSTAGIEEANKKILEFEAKKATLEGDKTPGAKITNKGELSKIQSGIEFWTNRRDGFKSVASGDPNGLAQLKKFLMPGESGDPIKPGQTVDTGTAKVTRVKN